MRWLIVGGVSLSLFASAVAVCASLRLDVIARHKLTVWRLERKARRRGGWLYERGAP